MHQMKTVLLYSLTSACKTCNIRSRHWSVMNHVFVADSWKKKNAWSLSRNVARIFFFSLSLSGWITVDIFRLVLCRWRRSEKWYANIAKWSLNLDRSDTAWGRGQIRVRNNPKNKQAYSCCRRILHWFIHHLGVWLLISGAGSRRRWQKRRAECFFLFLEPGTIRQWEGEWHQGVGWRMLQGRGGGQIGGVDTCVKDRCHTEQSRKWDSSQERDDGDTKELLFGGVCVCEWTRD